MSSRWYYQLLTEEFGPVAVEQLHDMLRTGILSEEDLVRSEDSEDWIPLSELNRSTLADSDAGGSVDIADLSELAFEFEDSGPTVRRQAYGAELPALESHVRPTSGSPKLAPSMNADSEQTPVNEPTGDQWYCESLGQILGPFLFDELIALAESGAVAADDRLRCGERGIWKTVECLPKVMRAVAVGNSIIPDTAQVVSAEAQVTSTAHTTPDRAADVYSHANSDHAAHSEPENQQSAAPAAAPEITIPIADETVLQASQPATEKKTDSRGKRRRKSPRGEEKLLDEIFDDVFNDDSPPTRPAATSSPAAAAQSPQAAPPPMTQPAPLSAAASPSSAASAGLAAAAAMAAAPTVRSPRRSISVDPKTIMMLVGVLLVLGGGYAAWQYGGALFAMTATKPFDKEDALRTLSAAMDRFQAILPNPSETDWNEFSNKTGPEMTALYKVVHERAGTTEEGVTCLAAIKAMNKISRTKPDNTIVIEQCIGDFEQSMASLKP